MLQAQGKPLGLSSLAKGYLRRHVPLNVRGHARRWILATPGISELYYAADPVARTMRLNRDTEILIDGFGRSANTFAVESFRLANPERSIAHHLHDQRRIRRAVARNLPVVLVIREPDGCVNSFVNGIPNTPPDFFYSAYARFYEELLSDLEGVVIADFTEITTSWPTIIERVNRKFDTAFEAAGHEAREQILKRVDDFGQAHAFGQVEFDPDRFEMLVSRPSYARPLGNASERATPEVRQRALAVYARVLASADKSP